MNATRYPAIRNWRRSPLLGFLVSLTLVALVLALLYAFGVHREVLALLQWFEAQGAWAGLWFILIMAAAMLLLLPGVLLTTGAGFVFGVLQGTLYVVAGTLLGSMLAFLLARHLLGARARTYISSHRRLQRLNEELKPGSWQLILLTRLIPFFPSKLSNYVFGLTRVSFGSFVLGSAIGFVPYSLHSVYLGSLAAELAVLGVRETPRSPLEWAIYGTGFLATLIAVFYLNRLARRILGRHAQQDEVIEEVT